MTFHATRRGAAIVGLWLVLAGALAVFLFGPGGWVSALLLAAWAAAVYGGFVPRLASAKLYVGRHHVSARWGMLFPSVRRFPRRFVTGCHILETPLCRLTGVCVPTCSSSGAFLILPGFESNDAQHVARLPALGEGQP